MPHNQSQEKVMNIIRRIAVLFGAPITTHPDGQVYVRIRDRWLPA